jgi:hypothetical protein
MSWAPASGCYLECDCWGKEYMKNVHMNDGDFNLGNSLGFYKGRRKDNR